MKLYDEEILELIEDVLKQDRLKYPLVEKRSAAGEGLAIGIKNYDRYPMAEKAYLKWQIRKKLEEEYRNYWDCRQVESSFSLDKYFSESAAEVAVMALPSLRTHREYVEDIVCWRDFRKSLCADLNRLLWKIIDGYTIDEICEDECLEPVVILERIDQLEEHYRFYYEI